jgi:hypothetical protein
MDHVLYEHESRWTYGWCACAVAVVALLLLVVDLVDHSAGPTGNRAIGSSTYAAIAAAGAMIQPSDLAKSLPAKIVTSHERVSAR